MLSIEGIFAAEEKECSNIDYVVESLNYIYKGSGRSNVPLGEKDYAKSIYDPLLVLITNAPECLIAAFHEHNMDSDTKIAIINYVRNGQKNCHIWNGAKFLWCDEAFPKLLKNLDKNK